MTSIVCKASRALTGETQRELATAAGISTQTIADFERGARQPHPNNLKAIRAHFEAIGLKFIEEDGEIVGIDFRQI